MTVEQHALLEMSDRIFKLDKRVEDMERAHSQVVRQMMKEFVSLMVENGSSTAPTASPGVPSSTNGSTTSASARTVAGTAKN